MPPFFKNNVLMSQLVQQLMSTRSSTAYVVNPLVIVITLIFISGRFVDWSTL